MLERYGSYAIGFTLSATVCVLGSISYLPLILKESWSRVSHDRWYLPTITWPLWQPEVHSAAICGLTKLCQFADSHKTVSIYRLKRNWFNLQTHTRWCQSANSRKTVNPQTRVYKTIGRWPVDFLLYNWHTEMGSVIPHSNKNHPPLPMSLKTESSNSDGKSPISLAIFCFTHC